MKITNKLLCVMILVCIFFNLLVMFPIKVFATTESVENTNTDTINDNSEDEVKPIDELQPCIVSDNGITEEGDILASFEKKQVEGVNFDNVYYLETQNTDSTTIAFMTPSKEVFGVETEVPRTQKKVLAPSSGGLKVTADGSITNSGVKISNKKGKINVGFGEYNGALCLEIDGTNTSKTEKYSVNKITLKDVDGNEIVFTLVVKCLPYDDSVENGKIELSFEPDGEVNRNSMFNIKNYDLEIEDVANIFNQAVKINKLGQDYGLEDIITIENIESEYIIENVGLLNGIETKMGDLVYINGEEFYLVEMTDKDKNNNITDRCFLE